MTNMAQKVWLALFLVGVYHGTSHGYLRRSKRALDQFQHMVKCTTHRQAFKMYNGYGCWCGLGGKGIPVDETDRCCKEHDECYSNSIDKGKCSELASYITRYHFTAECKADETITCEDALTLKESNGECASAICQCDRRAALCFSENISSYDSSFLGYDRRKKCK